MKRKVVLFVTVLSIFVAVPALAQVYPEGMISYWKLDDGIGTTASDSVGTNAGTVSGATWTSGIVDGALSFDGADDKVEASEISGYGNFSMAVWLMTDDTSRGGCVFETALGSIFLFAGTNGQGTIRLAAYRDRDGKGIRQYAYFKRFDEVIYENTWHFAVLTADESNGHIKAYLDGEFLGDLEWGYMGLSAIHSYTTIGADRYLWAGYVGDGWFFSGLTDEVAVYNRVLTPDEIWQHYQNGLEGLGVPAAVDLHPHTLNLKSKGKWVTTYIELPDGYDVAGIDVSTVMLEGTIPAEDHPTEMGDYDDDGITDLMVKFDRQALIKYLDGTTGEVTLTVSGELGDGTPFKGSDTITVINPGK